MLFHALILQPEIRRYAHPLDAYDAITLIGLVLFIIYYYFFKYIFLVNYFLN